MKHDLTKDNRPTTSKIIKDEMEKQGINGKKLSGLTGLSEATISDILSNKKGASDDAYQRICAALSIPFIPATPASIEIVSTPVE